MYLYIFESGEIMKSDNVSEGDLESVDAGILEIINMENGTYYLGEGTWVEVELIDPDQ